MSANRTRKNRVVVRLTEEEFDVLKQRMRDEGTQNREAYLRKQALTGYILRLEFPEVRENIRHLADATSSINQVAKRVNETRSIYADDMIQLRKEVSNARSQVSDIVKIFKKIEKFYELFPEHKKSSRA